MRGALGVAGADAAVAPATGVGGSANGFCKEEKEKVSGYITIRKSKEHTPTEPPFFDLARIGTAGGSSPVVDGVAEAGALAAATGAVAAAPGCGGGGLTGAGLLAVGGGRAGFSVIDAVRLGFSDMDGGRGGLSGRLPGADEVEVADEAAAAAAAAAAAPAAAFLVTSSTASSSLPPLFVLSVPTLSLVTCFLALPLSSSPSLSEYKSASSSASESPSPPFCANACDSDLGSSVLPAAPAVPAAAVLPLLTAPAEVAGSVLAVVCGEATRAGAMDAEGAVAVAATAGAGVAAAAAALAAAVRIGNMRCVGVRIGILLRSLMSPGSSPASGGNIHSWYCTRDSHRAPCSGVSVTE